MKASQSLIEGIEKRMRKIQDNPGYFTQKSELLEQDLRNEADLHSFWLEHPELRGKLLELNHVSDEKGIKKIAKRGIANIKSGWIYLNSNKFKESKSGVLGYMTPDNISQVGRLIDPIKNHAGFRQGFVSSPFTKYTPHSPFLVPGMIENLCNDIKNFSDYHPVELAAETHLRIAGIQPFMDGNKRSARLFERRILEGYGFPTSFIPLGERDVYLDLVDNALKGLVANDVYSQTPFFDYIGGKVTVALDKIIDDLGI